MEEEKKQIIESPQSFAKDAVLEKGEELVKNMELFDNVVTQSYLRKLSKFEIKQRPGPENTPMRWCKITKIVKEKDVFFGDILSMLYISLHDVAKNVVLVLDKNIDGQVDLYLGARDFEGDKGNNMVSGDTLEAGLKGFLPGIKFDHAKYPENYNIIEKEDEYEKLQEEEFDPKRWKLNDTYVSSVSVLASLRDDKKENFVQGIEKLINASSAIPVFTAYFIAENVSDSEATSMIQAFNELQTYLSPMVECQVTYSASHTEGISKSLTKSFSETVTKNISKTVSHSEGWSINHSDSTTNGYSFGGNQGVSVIIASAGINFNINRQKTITEQIGTNGNDSIAIQKGLALGQQLGKQEQQGENESDTKGVSMQITQKDSEIKRYVDLIDRQVERLQNGIPFGLWSVATYFVAKQDNSVLKLANIYKGCLIGEESNLSAGAINFWKQYEAKKALDYLNTFEHPQIKYEGIMGPVTPGSIVTSKELAIHLSLPQSSVPGVLVRDEQSFGRNIPEGLSADNSIGIGKILHLGEESEDNEVCLDIASLNKHVFVTGTTGSGKSNTLYQIISGLHDKGIRFLIIEPAKGEYKQVFGNREDVSVYGSNPKKTPLLHINPFEFPEEIDVYQHIDALVEVFNACWPMYAAMPQVLSHSIIEAYKSCGWDMEHSLNPNKKFPSINDVLECLKDYINKTEYSSDTKGDYKGSLETRLQSLCDGTVGRIFKGESIPDEELFNGNVIVDLSEVKSSETNSLIMGLLVLKLNEFRSSEKEGMNRNLHHVTVLEEAHNLLKRTSTNQITESSNVAGMAVEKIANSMAEMRTYGEGFIIADQSPSMLDLATIRNTNTKIIMALPEKDDRETAGKSIGLDDKHIEEISKLKTGEAIVYQSGWEEAVKAKITKYETPKQPWTYKLEEPAQVCDNGAITKICSLLALSYTSVDNDFDRQELLDLLVAADIPVGRFNTIKQHLENHPDEITPEDIAFVFATMIGTEIFESAKRMSDMSVFNAKISRCLSNKLGLANDEKMNVFVNMYMKGCSLKAETPFYEGWLQSTIKLM